MNIRAILAVLVIAANNSITVPGLTSAAELVVFKDLGADCLKDSWLSSCEVLSAGYLNTTIGGPRIAYQIQHGSKPGGSDGSGIVLLEAKAGSWTMFASDYLGAFYKPLLLSEGPLLHVPAYDNGTAANNADLLFKWNEKDSTWHAIDLTAWQNGIGISLPPGTSIWKGVDYDFSDPWLGLFARTSLWKESDADCCPTGGNANIDFTIVDDVLVAGKITYSHLLDTKP